MASRTFLPRLVTLLLLLCGYMQRYENQIKKRLPEGGAAAFDGVIVACQAFEAIVEPLIPPGT